MKVAACGLFGLAFGSLFGFVIGIGACKYLVWHVGLMIYGASDYGDPGWGNVGNSAKLIAWGTQYDKLEPFFVVTAMIIMGLFLCIDLAVKQWREP